jgi:hypothetical protein
MAHHQQGRSLAGWGLEIGVVRGIIIAVSGQAAFGRELDELRDREIARVNDNFSG